MGLKENSLVRKGLKVRYTSHPSRLQLEIESLPVDRIRSDCYQCGPHQRPWLASSCKEMKPILHLDFGDDHWDSPVVYPYRWTVSSGRSSSVLTLYPPLRQRVPRPTNSRTWVRIDWSGLKSDILGYLIRKKPM